MPEPRSDLAAAGTPTRRRWRLTHVITDLDTGGAEMMLWKLLATMDPERYESRVVSLLEAGELGARIADLGIQVESLGMRRGRPRPADLLRLARRLRAQRPQLIQSWMYHADLMTTLAQPWLRSGLGSGRVPLLWNIRQSDLDPHRSKASTRLVVRLCARLSGHSPRRIVCCSERARAIHVALGYRADLFTLIPNGFDLERFRPDPARRAAVRQELGIPPEAPLVGLVTRFDPQKDIEGFVAAAAAVARAVPAVRFLLCGRGMDSTNADLTSWLARASLTGHCRLLGLRADTERLFAALDVAVSSSAYGEGFPNTIGEAMACGIPNAVTDVGDSAAIVGDTGAVAPPRDPDALTAAILGLLLSLGRTEREALGARARARIAADFALPAIARRYEALYEQLLATRP